MIFASVLLRHGRRNRINQVQYGPDRHCYVHPRKTHSFFVGRSSVGPLQRAYGSAEAKDAAEVIASACRTRIIFSPTDSRL
jgi:hypothetical protein